MAAVTVKLTEVATTPIERDKTADFETRAAADNIIKVSQESSVETHKKSNRKPIVSQNLRGFSFYDPEQMVSHSIQIFQQESSRRYSRKNEDSIELFASGTPSGTNGVVRKSRKSIDRRKSEA